MTATASSTPSSEAPLAAAASRATAPLLATRHGLAMDLSAEDPVMRSLRTYGEWAEQEVALLNEIATEGQSVLIFGAEFAAHALCLAHRVGTRGRVHLVEPRRLRFQQACANVALNGLANVFTYPLWLGSEHGEGDHDRTATLDSMALQALDIIKINEPGALLGVLDGGAQTIGHHRPVVHARLAGPDHADAEVQALKAMGYRVWSHLSALYSPQNHARTPRDIFPGVVIQAVVAAPAEGTHVFANQPEL